jgi:hypothetical protein
VQGHPGPSMRAASFQAQQQQSQKGQSQSIIMPIYTFGIVAFFVFTVVKIIMKKVDKKKVKPLEADPIFTDKVFKQSEPDPKKKLGESPEVFRTFSRFRGVIKAKFSFLFSRTFPNLQIQDGKITTQVSFNTILSLPNSPSNTKTLALLVHQSDFHFD